MSGAQVRVAGGAASVLGMLLLGFFLPLPYDPISPNAAEVGQAPNMAHWFGTDLSGLDVFSRTIASARRDLPLALVGTFISLALGVPLGLAASVRGKLGERIMRGVDAFQALPLLVLAIAIVTLAGNKVYDVVIAIAIVNVPRFMRLVRSEALMVRESRFVEAAVAIGCSTRRVMFRHILPNIAGVVLAQSSITAAHAIMIVAALNFLGVGVTPPDPTWGSMIQSGALNITRGQWWMSLFPGAAVFVAVLGLNTLADGVNELVERGAS